jgi:hypothetical protein
MVRPGCLQRMEGSTIALLPPHQSGAAERERRREIERVHAGAARWRERLDASQLRDYFELVGGRADGFGGGITVLMRRACSACSTRPRGARCATAAHLAANKSHRTVRMAMNVDRPALPPARVCCDDLLVASTDALEHIPRRE